MRVLLDTHAFIWWSDDPPKLSPPALALCSDPTTTMVLSIASAWEMQIKMQLGKLSLSLPLADIIARQQATNGIELLLVTLPHVLGLQGMPRHHGDPFDRIIIAQANVEGIPLLSHDRVFKGYAVTVLW
jgi:PIN domain nuclease of toxin-antitoxin system